MTSEEVGQKTFTMNILNQSGKIFNPGEEVKAHVTFEVINTGTHRVEIDTSLFNNLQLTNAEDSEKIKEYSCD